MTPQKYLQTRAVAAHRTWSKTIPGKVEFFSGEGSDTSIPILIAPLRGVDDSYPPQKKSFMMLKYMHDHYLDKYEWFMRADDDVYIKGDRLESFLRSLNSSEPLFLGQTGLGTTEEMGKLALEPGENFCMGGPGVIMSREVLRRTAPHIGKCLQEMYTTHEDVEVGSQYDPKIVYSGKVPSDNHFAFSQKTGFWRNYGFSITCIYKGDLVRMGGFDVSIQGWGLEDVDLFNNVAQEGLKMFRSQEVGVVHVHHPVFCDPNLDPKQYKMCLGSKASTYGSTQQLAEMWLEKNNPGYSKSSNSNGSMRTA
ncbi:Chondroitin sulfate synthase 1 [Heterocephalus glaber]|uniref:Hexosyltransferase n=1 Tax=Heterocephalus glaber TaxID=10181 RepID=G5BRI5_HETGA|nr:Chondroitin sulfate synthase 1 [Heterocephalus glaber]